jgi:hypothetical protein
MSPISRLESVRAIAFLLESQTCKFACVSLELMPLKAPRATVCKSLANAEGERLDPLKHINLNAFQEIFWRLMRESPTERCHSQISDRQSNDSS